MTKKTKPDPCAKLKKKNRELRKFAAEIALHSIVTVEQLEKARELSKGIVVVERRDPNPRRYQP